MHSLLLSFSLLSLAAPAQAAPDWRAAREYEVLLSSFDIQPQSISLKAGEPVRLRLINNSTISHSFSAKDFFSSGEVRPRDKKLVSSGKVDIGPGNTREVLIVPKAGRYSARCANLFHRVMGMSARIIVE
ncbi:MAG: cupredoxin domain-containing protein [Pseudomonadota bacterium]|nr:cupredoxin domain-containing protein [Pseudomonadota bacterium]